MVHQLRNFAVHGTRGFGCRVAVASVPLCPVCPVFVLFVLRQTVTRLSFTAQVFNLKLEFKSDIWSVGF